MKGMTAIASALREYLATKGIRDRVEQAGVIASWPNLVGPQIAAATRPEAVSADGILFVKVATAAWANELSLMAPRILMRLNDGRVGRIKEIRWSVGL
jgi:predicted nucleic acid-binding Zn ribbon protein